MSDPIAGWWRTFFQGVSLDLWKSFTTPELTRTETDFIVKTLDLSPPARILDAPCGTGRIAVELAARGFETVGVDLADYIEDGQRQARERGLSVRLERRDMRDLPWPGFFDAVVCWGNSFGYFDDAENIDFLRAVSAALRPGGQFLLNSGCVAESILPNVKERAWYDVGDILFLIHNRYDHVRGRLDSTLTYVRNGAVEKYDIFHRTYGFRELCGMLGDVGFTDFRAAGGLNGEAYHLGVPNLYLTMRKRA
jgi:SAM-dependent methyltransferase